MSPSGNSTNADTRPFPRPFGGIPVQWDFWVNLVYGVGFTIAFGINLYTLCRKRTRTTAKTASLILSLERMVGVIAMRMPQSLLDDWRESYGLNEYLQASFGAGFVTLMQEQSHLMVCAVTSATRDGLSYEEWLRAVEKNPSIKETRKMEREKFRKSMERMDLWFVVLQFFQIFISIQSVLQAHKGGADWLLYCRFFGNLVAVFIAATLLSKLHSIKGMDGINKVALRRMRSTLIIILFIPLGRCFLSFDTATTLSASPVDSDPRSIISKITFYAFQLLPELTACLITAPTDYKALCDTGMWMDWPRWRVESGLPAKHPCIAILQCIVTPWKWYRLVASRMCDKNKQQASQENRLHEYGFNNDPLSYEDGEKLLPHKSSIGWQSSLNLSSAGKSQRSSLDVERQSIQTEMTFASSDHSSSSGSQVSSGDSKSSLVADVNLWTPRFPTVFSV